MLRQAVLVILFLLLPSLPFCEAVAQPLLPPGKPAGVHHAQQTPNANAATSFTVLGTPLAQDAAALQAGFDLKLGTSATLSLSYDGSFSPIVENHAFRGALSWQF